MDYPSPSMARKAEFSEFKYTLVGLAILGVLVGLVWLTMLPKQQRIERERAYLWRVLYTDERVSAQLGSVREALMATTSSSSRRRAFTYAHHREENGSLVTGVVTFSVWGSKGWGDVLIHYRWDHDSGVHSVTEITVRPRRIGKWPNKAPEPTPGLVTPRAMECAFEVKRRNRNLDAARGAPSPVVAHL